MFLQILVLAAIGGYAVNGQFDTSSCADFDSKIDKCYTDNNLPVRSDVRTLGDIQNLFLQNTTEICGSFKDRFKNAVGCFIDLLRECISDDDKKLVASSSNYKEAYDILCSDGPTDRTCVGDYVKSCLSKKLTAAGLDPLGPSTSETYDSKKNHMCKQAEYYLSCVNAKPVEPTCRAVSIEKDCKIVTKLAPEACGDKLTPEACGAMSVIYTSILLAASLFVTVYNVVV